MIKKCTKLFFNHYLANFLCKFVSSVLKTKKNIVPLQILIESHNL